MGDTSSVGSVVYVGGLGGLVLAIVVEDEDEEDEDEEDKEDEDCTVEIERCVKFKFSSCLRLLWRENR